MEIGIRKLPIILLCLVTILATLSLSGCSGENAGADVLPASKYVALHEMLDEGFTIIEGDTGLVHPMTNPPGFSTSTDRRVCCRTPSRSTIA